MFYVFRRHFDRKFGSNHLELINHFHENHKRNLNNLSQSVDFITIVDFPKHFFLISIDFVDGLLSIQFQIKIIPNPNELYLTEKMALSQSNGIKKGVFIPNTLISVIIWFAWVLWEEKDGKTFGNLMMTLFGLLCFCHCLCHRHHPAFYFILWIVMDSVCSGRFLCMLNSLIKSYVQWNRIFPLFKMLNLSCIFYNIYVFKFNSMNKMQLKT